VTRWKPGSVCSYPKIHRGLFARHSPRARPSLRSTFPPRGRVHHLPPYPRKDAVARRSSAHLHCIGRANEAGFYRQADLVMPFKLDLSKKRQSKWDRLTMGDLPSVRGLRISSDIGHGNYPERTVLRYKSAAEHPRLPDYAARLGHLWLAAAATPAAELALVPLMRDLAAEGIVRQGYVETRDGDDEPKGTLYKRAADIHVHQRPREAGARASARRRRSPVAWPRVHGDATRSRSRSFGARGFREPNRRRWRSSDVPRRRCATLNIVSNLASMPALCSTIGAAHVGSLRLPSSASCSMLLELP
jgi:hypothetical protein